MQFHPGKSTESPRPDALHTAFESRQETLWKLPSACLYAALELFRKHLEDELAGCLHLQLGVGRLHDSLNDMDASVEFYKVMFALPDRLTAKLRRGVEAVALDLLMRSPGIVIACHLSATSMETQSRSLASAMSPHLPHSCSRRWWQTRRASRLSHAWVPITSTPTSQKSLSGECGDCTTSRCTQ